MFARKGKINLPNGNFIETPLLLPSFSSRGFSDVEIIMRNIRETFDGPGLVSAYDIFYGLINKNLNFIRQVIFIDSGGYECLGINEVIEEDRIQYLPKDWTEAKYEQTIQELLRTRTPPKVVVNFDHPEKRHSYRKQVISTNEVFSKFENKGHRFIKEILLKPENKSKRIHNVNNVIKNIKKLEFFDIIGFTEKELGLCLIDRMKNLMAIRKALIDNNMDKFIHVFGSLDTITTPLFFICGADIFDGLTWLRYAYHKGATVYQQNAWADTMFIDRKDGYSRLFTFMNNYNYLKKLTRQMKVFANTKDFKAFDSEEEYVKKGSIIKKIYEALQVN